MFDMDKFIECIHGKPALWEKRAKEYFDKNCRERSWDEVGETMYETWLDLEPAEREEKVKEMKNKWRRIRDNFHKFLNQGKSCDAAPKKKKKYIYADALQFLLDSMEERTTMGNVTENEDDDDWEEKLEEDEDGLPAAISNGPCTSFKPEESLGADLRQRGTPNLAPFQKKIPQSSMEEEDADKLFLMSLLSDCRKLDDDEKLDFKFVTLQFFRDVQRKKNSRVPPPQQSQSPSVHLLPPVNAFNQFAPMNPLYQFQRVVPMQAPCPYVVPSAVLRNATAATSPQNPAKK
ncbi:uncharacterized protein LOC134537693 [Bacillus rossius redtenbacheri]|uniref:uncharacterized protein LOC134537693 n=1 Tax=Bacillus rossius redtenbacheri TaxID=93214 RepID=UPI002FDE7F27